jgi:hypothetical protein
LMTSRLTNGSTRSELIIAGDRSWVAILRMRFLSNVCVSSTRARRFSL